ncbi:hypothetical protein IW262DRAFT_1404627 [Armillaria fumosa]|nr:hypothetical protein IW262DRAFT_1404627 [Armillaria fumosa]
MRVDTFLRGPTFWRFWFLVPLLHTRSLPDFRDGLVAMTVSFPYLRMVFFLVHGHGEFRICVMCSCVRGIFVNSAWFCVIVHAWENMVDACMTKVRQC